MTVEQVECPRCKGAGTIEKPVFCECGHDRSEHLSGFGCTFCAAAYGEQCLRFKRAKDET